jgi:hypothetical protein
MTVKRARIDVPVEKQTGKDGKQRKMAKPKLPVDAPLGEQSKVPHWSPEQIAGWLKNASRRRV